MPRNKRLTIGFLQYHEENDNHNLMMAGVLKAAQKHDVNIIQFGSQGRSLGDLGFHHEIQSLLKVIERQHLDGFRYRVRHTRSDDSENF